MKMSKIPPLGQGSHASIDDGACIMEAVSFVAGEPWSDHPVCACPVITQFLQSWNDILPDDERDTLLRPLIPRLLGTRGTEALEKRRVMMADDWLINEHTPAWLRLDGLIAQADALSSLPEITDFLQAAARAAAWAAAWNVSRDADRDEAWAEAWNVAWNVALSAARDAARDALNNTRLELQKSAVRLVDRMIEAKS